MPGDVARSECPTLHISWPQASASFSPAVICAVKVYRPDLTNDNERIRAMDRYETQSKEEKKKAKKGNRGFRMYGGRDDHVRMTLDLADLHGKCIDFALSDEQVPAVRLFGYA
jgi:hypothetical protein